MTNLKELLAETRALLIQLQSKKTWRKAISIFKYGLEHIANFLLNSKIKLISLNSCHILSKLLVNYFNKKNGRKNTDHLNLY